LIMDMPRTRPPHLHRELTRHGRAVWYVRVGKGPRIRLRALYGTPEFKAEYDAAVAGAPLERTGPANGTLLWLLERYRETTAWRDLSSATRRQRENIFKHVMDGAGREPFKAISRRSIVAGRDRRKDTPAQARNFLDAMRGLYRWALEADHVKIDPTAGVKNPARKKGQGFPKWTELEVEQYEQHWPRGTRQRVWLDVLLYTGLRRGDAVILGRQHVRDNVATLQTEKSGERVTVTLPLLEPLRRTLEAGPVGELAFICGANGKPLTKESFGNMFSEAARAAGVNKSAHGLRKIGATRAADNGATVSELEAIFGWSGGGMASLYTREADRARLAKGAMSKLANNAETATPAPSHKVRAKGQKTK
jgi:integrase